MLSGICLVYYSGVVIIFILKHRDQEKDEYSQISERQMILKNKWRIVFFYLLIHQEEEKLVEDTKLKQYFLFNVKCSIVFHLMLTQVIDLAWMYPEWIFLLPYMILIRIFKIPPSGLFCVTMSVVHSEFSCIIAKECLSGSNCIPTGV